MPSFLSNQLIPWLSFVFPSKPINILKNVAGHSTFREVLLTAPRSEVRSQKSDIILQCCFTEHTSLWGNRHLQLGFWGRLKLAMLKRLVRNSHTAFLPPHLSLQRSSTLDCTKRASLPQRTQENEDSQKKDLLPSECSRNLWCDDYFWERPLWGQTERERGGLVGQHMASSLLINP